MDGIEELTTIFKALADPTRLKLIKMLLDCSPAPAVADCGQDRCQGGTLCVNSLAARLGITQSAVSQHLRILKYAGLVNGERRGPFVHYAIDPGFLDRLKSALEDSLGFGFEG